ncbi:MAG: hypothetical protein HC837_04935 [Chloroflexaceae bacterium]|nr:hypothetical protein [Chloroflexaceae bacterium]
MTKPTVSRNTPAKRSNIDLKLLLTAAALAATLAGWAGFAGEQQAQQADTATRQPVVVSDQTLRYVSESDVSWATPQDVAVAEPPAPITVTRSSR